MEPIVFVDESGLPTGKTGPKLASHHANTPLHSAFSCYIFNDRGEFLVTRRAAGKKVWPNFWTNTVCGHPLPNESLEDAIIRRLKYELGMTAKDLKLVLPNYRYRTPPYNEIIENEFCPVFVARATSRPNPNSEEVSEINWLKWSDYIAKLEEDPVDYSSFAKPRNISATSLPVWSWWAKDQIKQLQNTQEITDYSQPTSS